MTTTNRIISGSLASWMQIGVTLCSQLLLVPVYLTYWTVETYGVWLAVQALLTMLVTLDYGHHNFLGYEFLRLRSLERNLIGNYLYAGIAMALLLGFLEVGIMSLLHISGVLRYLLGDVAHFDETLIKEAGQVLLIQGLAWWLVSSIGGILSRVLTAFGYFPRLAWWGVGSALVTAVAPAVTVALGAGLVVTGLASALGLVLFNVLLYADYFHLLRKEKVGFVKPSFRLAWQNFLSSLLLSGKKILEDSRNTGVRIILAPLVGASSLVAFSTIRTGANFAMQGLNTVIYPLMPELIRFLHQRDQERSETAFNTIWILIVGLMAPGILLLQGWIEPIFILWTKGKVAFNPMLFGLLSLSVLYYAFAQPAVAVVAGNNLLKTQLKLSSLAAGMMILGMVLLVPEVGITGAGAVLLIAECTVAFGYRRAADKWLRGQGLRWPKRSALAVEMAIWIDALTIAGLIYLPTWKYPILLMGLFLLGANLLFYWRTLPGFTRHRTKQVVYRPFAFKK